MASQYGAPTKARMDEIFEQVKNWGRWGKEDQAGALNLIDDDVRKRAAACVRHGRAVSCAYELAVHPAVDNPHPALHMMIAGGDDCLFPEIGLETTSDFVGLAFHGMATSHLDALCHVHVNGRRTKSPGYTLRKDDQFGLRPNERVRKNTEVVIESTKGRDVPSWLSVDAKEFTGKVLDMPKRDEAAIDLQEQLIVEFCSK